MLLLFILVAVCDSQTYCGHIASAVNVHIAHNKFAVSCAAELVEIVVYSYPCLALVLSHVNSLYIAVLGSSPYVDNIRIAVILGLAKSNCFAELETVHKSNVLAVVGGLEKSASAAGDINCTLNVGRNCQTLVGAHGIELSLEGLAAVGAYIKYAVCTAVNIILVNRVADEIYALAADDALDLFPGAAPVLGAVCIV